MQKWRVVIDPGHNYALIMSPYYEMARFIHWKYVEVGVDRVFFDDILSISLPPFHADKVSTQLSGGLSKSC
ncbi:unnamed protein product [Urochloa humidicola]